MYRSISNKKQFHALIIILSCLLSQEKIPGCCVGTLETLRLKFFGISRKLRTSRSHMTKALLSGLWFEVHVCMARPSSRGTSKWFTARFFCTLKHHNPKFERKYDYLELFCLSNSIFQKMKFEDNFSAKIEVDEWNQHGSCELPCVNLPRSLKYGQMGSETINCKLQFVVCSKMTKPLLRTLKVLSVINSHSSLVSHNAWQLKLGRKIYLFIGGHIIRAFSTLHF